MSTAACRVLQSASKRRSTVFKSLQGYVQCRLASPGAIDQTRASSSSSNSRWKTRQGKDVFAREAKIQGLKSRAAFKLLEMDAKYRIFCKGQTVVDLGYAPGSWSQVAADRTNGHVLGIDIIPAQPPRGVSTIQGNFLSPKVQALVKDYLVRNRKHRQTHPAPSALAPPPSSEDREGDGADATEAGNTGADAHAEAEAEEAVLSENPSYIDMKRVASVEPELTPDEVAGTAGTAAQPKDGRLVDIVLSDMSAPWDQTTGFGVNSLSNPYRRMMNTSGIAFRDHAGSMDLCKAALQFASDTLKNGGHFICKFYQGSEDKEFENKLKSLFGRVHREKPESSRSDSREAYFVALRRKGDLSLDIKD